MVRILIKSLIFNLQAFTDELKVKEDVINNLLKKPEKPEESETALLQTKVIDELASVKKLIWAKEENLKDLHRRKETCDKNIEECMEWLKCTVGKFPDVQSEPIDNALECTMEIYDVIDRQRPWLNSLIEKVVSMSKCLPEDERRRLNAQLEEIQLSYEEVRKQAEAHVIELKAKQTEANEKQKVFYNNVYDNHDDLENFEL